MKNINVIHMNKNIENGITSQVILEELPYNVQENIKSAIRIGILDYEEDLDSFPPNTIIKERRRSVLFKLLYGIKDGETLTSIISQEQPE